MHHCRHVCLFQHAGQLARMAFVAVLFVPVLRPPTHASAEEPASAVASVMRLLKSGRVPSARLGTVIKQIARRGNEHDLAYLFDQASASLGYDAALRLEAYRLLVDAAANRKVIPAGDLSRITQIITTGPSDTPELRLLAIRLAGLWKVSSALEPLQMILEDNATSPQERQAALDALTAIGGPSARKALVQLTRETNSIDVRSQAVAALANLDVDFAAERAATLLQELGDDGDPTVIVGAFLDREGGSRKLAAAVEKAPPSKDMAMLAMRHMYSVGRSDEELAGVLGRIAGIDANPQPLTKQQVAEKIKQVAAHGNAVRGEDVFRRADLSCTKCHALSKAGGQVGPDLSPLGASSPADYIINSISNPDQQIKEAFTTRVVVTVDGLVFQGIVVDRNDERLVLKDAKGEQVTVPTADIDEEVEGKSLMPKGLMKFMTEAEFVDLVKFLSMLGKPGTDYAIRQTPRMQRWRVLTDVPESLRNGTGDEAEQDAYLSGPTEQAPAYARVNGDLPLDDLATKWGPVLYLVGEVDVTQPGEIGVRLDSAEGAVISLGSFSSADPEFTLTLPRGRHAVMLQVDTRVRPVSTLRLELFRVPSSTAQFEVVDGA